MKSIILSRRTLLIGAIAGFSLSGALFLDIVQQNYAKLFWNNPAMILENAVFPTREPGPGLPMRLKIPEINVDTVVEFVGLTHDRSMDVPRNRANVAWLEIGQRPGEVGTAIMAGHYGRENGAGSVFDNLYKLRRGDKIFVEDSKGTTISFVVSETRRYNLNADASTVFASKDGEAHLNLVTCEGDWDKNAQQYPGRLVVFADREID